MFYILVLRMVEDEVLYAQRLGLLGSILHGHMVLLVGFENIPMIVQAEGFRKQPINIFYIVFVGRIVGLVAQATETLTIR